MNASRLREVLELLKHSESKYKIQKALDEVNAHFNNIVSAPQQPQHQQGFAEALDRLRKSMSSMVATFEPAQIDLFEEIGADEYFVSDIPGKIEVWVQENPITPAVARDNVNELISQRVNYLQQINQLLQNLKQIGIEVSELEPGTAEIGFLIPRDLFQDQFDQFIKKLEVINKIIREFSETATGSAEEIEVRQISSSDPLLFFGLATSTIGMIGATVTWALNTWKQVEEIREIRARTKAIPTFTEDELQFFDDKIKKHIETEIDKKAKELQSEAHDGDSRSPSERHTHLTWALQVLLSFVERGVKVEIRSLPPEPPEDAQDEEEAIHPEFESLQAVAQQLVFPEFGDNPVLELPPPKPPEQAAKAKPARSTKTKSSET